MLALGIISTVIGSLLILFFILCVIGDIIDKYQRDYYLDSDVELIMFFILALGIAFLWGGIACLMY